MFTQRNCCTCVCTENFGCPSCLRVKIEKYLETRASLFPETPLRPKHHYLTHYPHHILQFGPLMRVWTLRFESRHSYFKKCAQHSQNFINICHTFAEHHHDVIETTIDHLIELGASEVDDLAYLEEADLSGILKPIHIRKLLQHAKGFTAFF